MVVPKKSNISTNSDEEKQLYALLDLLEKLSIQVKYARGYFHGGLVRYRDQLFLYLNRAAKPGNKVEVIVTELQYIKIPLHLLTPELREILTNGNSNVHTNKILTGKKNKAWDSSM